MAAKFFYMQRLSDRWAGDCRILLASLLLSAPLFAAGLGQIRVHSALGERFEAVVLVAVTDSENLNSDCFTLISPHDESDVRVLRRARLDYKRVAGGGELRIQGADLEQEPLLRMALQLRCPQEDARGVAREYSVLIDPREYKAANIAPAIERVTPPLVASAPQTAITAPATLEKTPRRARAPQATPALMASTSLQSALARPEKSKKSKLKVAPERGDFRLQLSTAVLDPVRTDLNLSEEDKLKLRERLLLIDADDQTAQLLQLKDRISRLEKQLSVLVAINASTPAAAPAIKSRASVSKPASNAPFSNWLWLGFALLILLPLGFVLWRWKARNQAEISLFSFDTDFNNLDTVTQQPVDEPAPVKQGEQSPNTVARINDGWGMGDNMDVVSPVSVAEEAQLLLDHGLLRQAIDLLLHEVGLRPTALALWMKLFDAYRTAADAKGFQAQALVFQTHFASETMWRQVQAIGRDIDPDNALYIVHEAASLDELAVPVNSDPSGNDDFDILSMIQRAERHEPEPLSSPTARVVDLPLEFHLPEVTLPVTQGEWSDHAEHAPFVQEDDHLFGFDVPSLELPVLKTVAGPRALSPENFTSPDAVLQTIARMIFGDQREEACQQLEELLYKGTFEQRLVAAKWLDQLTPVRSD